MRRKEREITDPAEVKEILEKAEVLRIALNNGVYPYVFPVNFGYQMQGEQMMLFFHGAQDGTKHEIIQRDPHVAFEMDCETALIPPKGMEACTASYAYASVIGQGIIQKAEEAEKEPLLGKLLHHYGIQTMPMNPNHLARTTVYKILVEHYTAKLRKKERS